MKISASSVSLSLFAIILASLARLSTSFPTELKTRTDLGADKEMPRAIPDLPCVDNAEPYYCDFEIIMNDACIDQSMKFLMMDHCRYSCNFC